MTQKTDHELLTETVVHLTHIRDFAEKFPEECEKRFASKERLERVEWFQKLIITGVMAWLVTNLLGLITKTQAAINIIF